MEFKRLSTNKKVDITTYIPKYLEKYPDTKLLVSTDSQVHNHYNVKFATVIALHNTNRGATVLYQITKEKFKDNFTRLYSETEYSIKVANFIRETIKVEIDFIEMDYNSDKKYFSNKVLLSALGHVKGMGYKPTVKPNCLSVYAADRLAKSNTI